MTRARLERFVWAVLAVVPALSWSAAGAPACGEWCSADPDASGWSHAPCDEAEAQPSNLDLELLQTYPLPAGVRIRGGALVERRPMIWGPSSLILYGEAGAPHVVPLDSSGEFVGMGVEPTTRALLGWDALQGAIHTLSQDGVPVDMVPVPGFPDATRAERAEGSWIVQVFEEGDSATFFSVIPDGGISPVRFALDAFSVPDSAPPIRPLRLMGSDRSGGWVVEERAPWRVWHISASRDTRHPRLLSGSEVLFDRASAVGFPTAPVAPVSILPLDQGHLYELAHLGGDERLLALFDDEGCLARVTLIDVALGFLASDPERRLLLGVRDIGIQELVLYGWQWSEDSSSNSREGAKP